MVFYYYIFKLGPLSFYIRVLNMRISLYISSIITIIIVLISFNIIFIIKHKFIKYNKYVIPNIYH